MKSALPIADLFTGMYALTAMLAALRHAERTGVGQHLDISLLDSQLAVLANLGSSYHLNAAEPQRFGNAHAAIAPYQVFATADGYVVLAVGNDGQFRSFCKAADVTLAADDRFSTNAQRVANRVELADAIAAVMSARPTAYWMHALENAGVPCGPINTVPQVFADAHVRARGAVESLTRADGRTIHLTRSPIRMSETPPVTRCAPPLIGQDTDAVLRDMLQLPESDVRRLRAAQVI